MRDADVPIVDLTALDPVLDDAPCGFVSFGDDGVIRAANRTLARMLGRGVDTLVGQHVETMLTVGSRIFYQTHLFPLLRLQGRANEIFLLLKGANGEDVAALTNAARHVRDGGPVNDCVLIALNERRKFEDALLAAKKSAEDARAETDRLRKIAEEANRAKSAFLATMSHELRTPLNAIGGYVQLLEMGIHGPVTPAQVGALGRVAQSQRHLLRLINEVLNLAKIESGRVEYAIDNVSVAELVRTVLPMVEPQLASRNLRYDTNVQPDLVARADRDKVEQILINLLSNAMKFTPPGGAITIAARPSDEAGCVDILIRDTGIGIPAERLAQVFEPFVQVDESLASLKAGTGLGLAISRDLARGMGGDLTAESVVGEGSVFRLILKGVGSVVRSPSSVEGL